MAFAQGITLAATIEIAAPVITCKRFGQHRFVIDRVERRGQQSGRRYESTAKAHQQIVGGGVQIEAEEVGQEAMIAGAVDFQIPLEFLVAVLVLATCRVIVVGRGLVNGKRVLATRRVGWNAGPACGLSDRRRVAGRMGTRPRTDASASCLIDDNSPSGW
jgi:hypothetical protein